MLVGIIQRKDSYLNKCEKHWIQNQLARFIISMPFPGLEYANVHCNYLVGPAHRVFPGHLTSASFSSLLFPWSSLWNQASSGLVCSMFQNSAGAAELQDWEPTCSYMWNGKNL